MVCVIHKEDGLIEPRHEYSTCLEILNHVIRNDGGMRSGVHNKGGVGHLVV